MGVISVRLNKDEEKILKKLSDHFHEDKSALIKKSLFELYENVLDLNEIKSLRQKKKGAEKNDPSADCVIPIPMFRQGNIINAVLNSSKDLF